LQLGQDQITEDPEEFGPQVLRKFYQEATKDLSPQVRACIEDRLITESGFRIALPMEDCLHQPGLDKSAIATLVDRRLLRIDPTLGAPRIELIHDRLIEAIVNARKERQERERLEREQKERLRRLLLPQALATRSLVQLNRGEDKQAALLARQAHLFNGEVRRGVWEQDQTLEVVYSEQVLFDILSAVYPSYLLEGHTKEVSSVAFSPDGRILATGGYDGRVCLWDVRQHCAIPRPLNSQQGPVTSLAFDPRVDRLILAVDNSDNTIRLDIIGNSVAIHKDTYLPNY
jgi:hypothetical protein